LTIGIIRATSALACARVTPGFSRAMPWKLKLPRTTLLRSNRKGSNSSGFAPRNRKSCGMTPMISRGSPSTTIRRPIADALPPNLRCQ
jgi:hypothetical protein